MSRHSIKDALLNSIMTDEIADKHISSGLASKLSNIPNERKRKRTDSGKQFLINGIKFTAKCLLTQKHAKYTPGIWGIKLSNDKDITISLDEVFSYIGEFEKDKPKNLLYWKMISLLDDSVSHNTVQAQSTPHIANPFEKSVIEEICKRIESNDSNILEKCRILDPHKLMKQ